MKILLSGGTVVSMDPAVGDLVRGDVLIENGVITGVDECLDAPDAEIIDATDRIVMPGFVDNHRHTWQTAFRGIGADWTFPEWALALHGILKPHYRPEDVYAATLLGRLEALHSGVTTMLDWHHVARTPQHVDAAVAALRDAPGRSVFCLGAGWGTPDPVDTEVRRVHRKLSGDKRVTLAVGLRGPDDTGMPTVARELALAAELGLRTSLHIASDGTQRPVADLREHGLLRDTTTFVHANGVSDEELRMLADAGSSVSISPDVELKMGFGHPVTGRALAAGLRPTLSTDDVPSAAGDLFSTMRTAFAVQRGLDGGLRSRDLLEFATVDAAHSCGLGHRTGSITPGKDADLVLLRTDDPTVFPVTDPVATIVSAGHPGLVDTVLAAGRVVKRDGALVGVDLPGLRARLLASRNRIARAAGIPLDGTWRPRPEPEE
ncbi:amidohydrolase family protein [Streptomyces clavuligerus]|uniref:Amidohydrolase-like protein n=1 Tax=Streptomyces clavuligerus TaxID=1901 RepID=B5GZC6_STRCL|nr:amidohydrolase family protein [Streptomyces clavuligerus]ANW16765.1 hydrolase [Streptomyces clavuligerus]AXU11293.1 hydrolase [Streptomyces clavuligerus]EDY51672.1 amidohydrolase [Streptomyces clavuligerus]EFG10734.1 Amidohydrolase-like protein [Streptomyces clavuligerus]MBY6301098.1 amidohydrolase family protein [Streptomyces clavuligerus]